MPFEINMTNVNIEAGRLPSGIDDNGNPFSDEDAPWVLIFHDPFTNIPVKVSFTPEKLRETCVALLGALDGETPKKKPDLVVAHSLPR